MAEGDLVPAEKSSEKVQKEEETKDDPNVHPVFNLIKKTEADKVIGAVRNYFELEGVSVEIMDGSGMTPLMHACWKGNVDLAKFLINQGADVNGGDHEHRYTPLHFAALAGKSEVCKLLVENGAKTEEINSVKRTASQMGAFVGNHECVAIINNYVPKESVYYFTRKQPFEEKAKLPIELAKPLHQLVMLMNTHPVRVAITLKANPILFENLPTVCNILELMSDREFKNRRDVNEVLSLKFHILHYIVKDMKKLKEKEDSTGESKNVPFLDRWIKSMLVGREEDGYPVFQENFLRQGVKEFAFHESQLFKTLVTNFQHCQNYGEGVTAAEYINQAFNGQKGFQDENCETCGNEKAEKKCAKCKAVQYCDRDCQKYHWFVHKKYCAKIKEKKEKLEKENKEKVSKENTKAAATKNEE